MRELIEFMARSIVDDPDAVEVEAEEGDGRTVYHLYVADDDMGKVIGRQGRIANAMRTMIKIAAVRQDVYASLEIGH